MATVLKWGNLTMTADTKKIMVVSGYNRQVSYKTETQENGTKKPKTVNKGPELDRISVTVELMAVLGVNVSAVIKQWRSACSSGKANALKIGGAKESANKWQVKDITVSNATYQKNMAKLASATLQINFVEWYAKGSTKKSNTTSTKKKKKKPASSTVQNSTTDKPPTQLGGHVTE